MLIEPKSRRLKNGEEAVFRSPEPSDAEEMLQYLKDCANETDFLLREPEECTNTRFEEETWIRAARHSETSAMIVCAVNGEIAGTSQIVFEKYRRVKHRATVVISLRKKYWGLGIGTALFEEMFALAREKGVLQLELGHMEGNDRAHHLYEKMGFAPVAERPDAFRMKDGTMRKEIWMVKKL